MVDARMNVNRHAFTKTSLRPLEEVKKQLCESSKITNRIIVKKPSIDQVGKIDYELFPTKLI